MYRSVRSFSRADLTSSPGVAITALVPPRGGNLAKVEHVLYQGAPAHDHGLTILKAVHKVYLSAVPSAGQRVINLATLPTSDLTGDIAAGDWLCLQTTDSADPFWRAQVASVSSLQVTLTEDLPAASTAGFPVWLFGAPADHGSSQSLANQNQTEGLRWKARAGVPTERRNDSCGLVVSNNPNEPLLFHSDNLGSAGVLLFLGGAHVQAAALA